MLRSNICIKIQQDQERFLGVHEEGKSMTIRELQVWGVSDVLSWCCVSLGP